MINLTLSALYALCIEVARAKLARDQLVSDKTFKTIFIISFIRNIYLNFFDQTESSSPIDSEQHATRSL